MSCPQPLAGAESPREAADRVLRRAQVSKMTRALQDRLALANVKIKYGWQHRSIDSLEPEIELHLKRKRADSNGDAFSDSSSVVSGRFSSADLPSSSPLTGPVFSDNMERSGSCRVVSKRAKFDPVLKQPASSTHQCKVPRTGRLGAPSWKAAFQLPQSSPIGPRPSASDLHDVSFASQTSTILNSPSASEDDEEDLPLHSFQVRSEALASSPPRTPPPSLARSARLRNTGFAADPDSSAQAGREGADLLLYLATSPSPAMRVNKTDMFPPSTPPSKHTPLPSSMMSTPGGQMYPGFGSTTPGTAFNFADYLNVTPSPAQGAWTKTPRGSRTPLATRETRRRLNIASPNPGTIPRSTMIKDAGLGMELGGELVR